MSFFKKVKIDQKKKEEKKNPPAPTLKEKGLFKPEGQLAIDVYETDSEFVVVSAIAGVDIKDLDISIDKDMLVIKGCRQDHQESRGKNYFYQECYWGNFSRKILLPEGVDVSKTEAQMDRGILIIKIPKIRREEKKKIEIKE